MKKAIILAGGLGTRLAPYTTVFPKPLMPLGNHPILEVIICQLREHGFTDITLAVGYLAHLLQTYFGDGSRFGVNIHYSFEEEPLGTAGPLKLVENLTEPFLVMNGDVLTNLNYSELYAHHLLHDAAATISIYPKKVKIDLGVLELDENSQVRRYIEKPTYSYDVSMGIYILSPETLRYIPANQRYDLPTLVEHLMADGERVSAYHCKGEWLDIGRPDDYAHAVEQYHNLIDVSILPNGSVTRPLPPVNLGTGPIVASK
ncbi:MAG: NTP transferase domain-containing protein [Chloroflexi bacterium]|nr:NTP transferase domain-containing protein [Chloroflexota bacterium]MDA0244418.1 sugar phosphate nucleotidyltransferase [Chloroflexota bacterium]